MITKYSILFSFAIMACGGVSIEEDSDPPSPWEYSQDLGGVSDCNTFRTTCDDVKLRCSRKQTLTDSCLVGVSEVIEIWNLPNAGDGKPFGVASCIELDSSECK